MNAIQFIQENGVDKAREVVANADKWTRITKCARFLFKDADSHGEVIREHGKDSVAIDDLKRLVESVDLVKEHYTLDRAIDYANSDYTAPEIKVCLLDAIADYKSIYGGEHV